MNDPSTGIAAPDHTGDELRHQWRLVSEVQEVAHIGIWEWEVDRGRVTWSPELYRIYGVSPQDYAPTFEGYLQKVHPRDRQRVRAAIEHAFLEGTSFSHDEQILSLIDQSGIFTPGATRFSTIVDTLRE